MSFSSPANDDYQSVQVQLDFPASQTRAEYNITIVDDNVIEDEESFQLLLFIPEVLTSIGVQYGPNTAATVTIMEDNGELVELCTSFLYACTTYGSVEYCLSLMFHRSFMDLCH